MAPDPAFPPQTQSDNSSLGPGSSASPNSNSSELFLFGARLEFDAHIREYDSLQSEVHARISKQQDITSFAIALIAGFAALTQVLPARPHLELTSPQILPLYPAIALILSAFALMTLDHELNIALIYKYIDRILRPQTEKLLRMAAGHPSPCWNWNQVRAYEQHHAGA
jgi:hypothetical protein